MKRQALFLVALLASTALVGCGGKKHSSSSSELPPSVSSSSSAEVSSSSSLAPSSSSAETPSSSSIAPSSSSSSAAPSSSSSIAPSSSSSEAPSSSSEAPSSSSSEAPSSSSSQEPSSSSQPSSSSSNPGPTPIILPEPNFEDEIDNSKKNLPSEVLVNRRIVSVLIDQTFQLETLAQFGYSGKNVNFVSNDESIATVSENGLITGKASGETVVVVSDKDYPNIKTEVRVIVSPEITADEAVDLKTRAGGFSEKAKAENLRAIIDHEMYVKTIYKNGVMHTYNQWDQHLTVSKDDAYFRIKETDANIIADNGSIDFKDYEYIFETNQYYDTYIFHTVGDTKNYLLAPTQSYMSGNDRTAPLIDVLDNFFTSGARLLSQTLENATLSDAISSVGSTYRLNPSYGSRGEGCLQFSSSNIYEMQTADLDDESRYGIPYGTPLPYYETLTYTIEDNKVIALVVELEVEYDVGNDHYRLVSTSYHTYEDVVDKDTDPQKYNSQIFIPNKKDYTLVQDIFDL